MATSNTVRIVKIDLTSFNGKNYYKIQTEFQSNLSVGDKIFIYDINSYDLKTSYPLNDDYSNYTLDNTLLTDYNEYQLGYIVIDVNNIRNEFIINRLKVNTDNSIITTRNYNDEINFNFVSEGHFKGGNMLNINNSVDWYDGLIGNKYNFPTTVIGYERIIDFVNDAPISPVLGDKYIVDSGINDFLNKNNQIAEYNGTDWNFYQPINNLIVTKTVNYPTIEEYYQYDSTLEVWNIYIPSQFPEMIYDNLVNVNAFYENTTINDTKESLVYVDTNLNVINSNVKNEYGFNYFLDGVIRDGFWSNGKFYNGYCGEPELDYSVEWVYGYWRGGIFKKGHIVDGLFTSESNKSRIGLEGGVILDVIADRMTTKDVIFNGYWNSGIWNQELLFSVKSLNIDGGNMKIFFDTKRASEKFEIGDIITIRYAGKREAVRNEFDSNLAGLTVNYNNEFNNLSVEVLSVDTVNNFIILDYVTTLNKVKSLNVNLMKITFSKFTGVWKNGDFRDGILKGSIERFESTVLALPTSTSLLNYEITLPVLDANKYDVGDIVGFYNLKLSATNILNPDIILNGSYYILNSDTINSEITISFYYDFETSDSHVVNQPNLLPYECDLALIDSSKPYFIIFDTVFVNGLFNGVFDSAKFKTGTFDSYFNNLTPKTRDSYLSNFINSIWYGLEGSTWIDGYFKGGQDLYEWIDGIFYNGIFENLPNAQFTNGKFIDGIFKGGIFKGGEFGSLSTEPKFLHGSMVDIDSPNYTPNIIWNNGVYGNGSGIYKNNVNKINLGGESGLRIKTISKLAIDNFIEIELEDKHKFQDDYLVYIDGVENITDSLGNNMSDFINGRVYIVIDGGIVDEYTIKLDITNIVSFSGKIINYTRPNDVSGVPFNYKYIFPTKYRFGDVHSDLIFFIDNNNRLRYYNGFTNTYHLTNYYNITKIINDVSQTNTAKFIMVDSDNSKLLSFIQNDNGFDFTVSDYDNSVLQFTPSSAVYYNSNIPYFYTYFDDTADYGYYNNTGAIILLVVGSNGLNVIVKEQDLFPFTVFADSYYVLSGYNFIDVTVQGEYAYLLSNDNKLYKIYVPSFMRNSSGIFNDSPDFTTIINLDFTPINIVSNSTGIYISTEGNLIYKYDLNLSNLTIIGSSVNSGNNIGYEIDNVRFSDVKSLSTDSFYSDGIIINDFGNKLIKSIDSSGLTSVIFDLNSKQYKGYLTCRIFNTVNNFINGDFNIDGSKYSAVLYNGNFNNGNFGNGIWGVSKLKVSHDDRMSKTPYFKNGNITNIHWNHGVNLKSNINNITYNEGLFMSDNGIINIDSFKHDIGKELSHIQIDNGGEYSYSTLPTITIDTEYGIDLSLSVYYRLLNVTNTTSIGSGVTKDTSVTYITGAGTGADLIPVFRMGILRYFIINDGGLNYVNGEIIQVDGLNVGTLTVDGLGKITNITLTGNTSGFIDVRFRTVSNVSLIPFYTIEIIGGVISANSIGVISSYNEINDVINQYRISAGGTLTTVGFQPIGSSPFTDITVEISSIKFNNTNNVILHNGSKFKNDPIINIVGTSIVDAEVKAVLTDSIYSESKTIVNNYRFDDTTSELIVNATNITDGNYVDLPYNIGDILTISNLFKEERIPIIHFFNQFNISDNVYISLDNSYKFIFESNDSIFIYGLFDSNSNENEKFNNFVNIVSVINPTINDNQSSVIIELDLQLNLNNFNRVGGNINNGYLSRTKLFKIKDIDYISGDITFDLPMNDTFISSNSLNKSQNTSILNNQRLPLVNPTLFNFSDLLLNNIQFSPIHKSILSAYSINAGDVRIDIDSYCEYIVLDKLDVLTVEPAGLYLYNNTVVNWDGVSIINTYTPDNTWLYVFVISTKKLYQWDTTKFDDITQIEVGSIISLLRENTIYTDGDFTYTTEVTGLTYSTPYLDVQIDTPVFLNDILPNDIYSVVDDPNLPFISNERYIIGATPAGDFSTFITNNIAEYRNNTWYEYVSDIYVINNTFKVNSDVQLFNKIFIQSPNSTFQNSSKQSNVYNVVKSVKLNSVVNGSNLFLNKINTFIGVDDSIVSSTFFHDGNYTNLIHITSGVINSGTFNNSTFKNSIILNRDSIGFSNSNTTIFNGCKLLSNFKYELNDIENIISNDTFELNITDTYFNKLRIGDYLFTRGFIGLNSNFIGKSRSKVHVIKDIISTNNIEINNISNDIFKYSTPYFNSDTLISDVAVNGGEFRDSNELNNLIFNGGAINNIVFDRFNSDDSINTNLIDVKWFNEAEFDGIHKRNEFMKPIGVRTATSGTALGSLISGSPTAGNRRNNLFDKLKTNDIISYNGELYIYNKLVSNDTNGLTYNIDIQNSFKKITTSLNYGYVDNIIYKLTDYIDENSEEQKPIIIDSIIINSKKYINIYHQQSLTDSLIIGDKFTSTYSGTNLITLTGNVRIFNDSNNNRNIKYVKIIGSSLNSGLHEIVSFSQIAGVTSITLKSGSLVNGSESFTNGEMKIIPIFENIEDNTLNFLKFNEINNTELNNLSNYYLCDLVSSNTDFDYIQIQSDSLYDYVNNNGSTIEVKVDIIKYNNYNNYNHINTLNNSLFNGGYFLSGEWTDGLFLDGCFGKPDNENVTVDTDLIWRTGVFYSGLFYGGIFYDGAFKSKDINNNITDHSKSIWFNYNYENITNYNSITSSSIKRAQWKNGRFYSGVWLRGIHEKGISVSGYRYGLDNELKLNRNLNIWMGTDSVWLNYNNLAVNESNFTYSYLTPTKTIFNTIIINGNTVNIPTYIQNSTNYKYTLGYRDSSDVYESFINSHSNLTTNNSGINIQIQKYDSMFNGGVWLNGYFTGGLMINSIWKSGILTNGLFALSTWLDGDFKSLDSTGNSYFGLSTNDIKTILKLGVNILDYGFNDQYGDLSMNKRYIYTDLNNANDDIFSNRFIDELTQSNNILSSKWFKGNFENGNFTYSVWYSIPDLSIDYNIWDNHSSVFKNGLFDSSLWKSGKFGYHDGINFYGGEMRNSEWVTGICQRGNMFNVIWNSGIFERGRFKLGVWNSGVHTFDIAPDLDRDSQSNLYTLSKIKYVEYPIVYIEGADEYVKLPLYINDYNITGLFNLSAIDIQSTEYNNLLVDGLTDRLSKGDIFTYITDTNDSEVDITPNKNNTLNYVNFYRNQIVEKDTGDTELYFAKKTTSVLFDFKQLILPKRRDFSNGFSVYDLNILAYPLRNAGGVDNLSSFWMSGIMEGTVWNGGTWLNGSFKEYNTQDNITVGMFTRGLWFSGFFSSSINSTSNKYRKSVFMPFVAPINDNEFNSENKTGVNVDYMIRQLEYLPNGGEIVPIIQKLGSTTDSIFLRNSSLAGWFMRNYSNMSKFKGVVLNIVAVLPVSNINDKQMYLLTTDNKYYVYDLINTTWESASSIDEDIIYSMTTGTYHKRISGIFYDTLFDDYDLATQFNNLTPTLVTNSNYYWSEFNGVFLNGVFLDIKSKNYQVINTTGAIGVIDRFIVGSGLVASGFVNVGYLAVYDGTGSRTNSTNYVFYPVYSIHQIPKLTCISEYGSIESKTNYNVRNGNSETIGSLEIGVNQPYVYDLGVEQYDIIEDEYTTNVSTSTNTNTSTQYTFNTKYLPISSSKDTLNYFYKYFNYYNNLDDKKEIFDEMYVYRWLTSDGTTKLFTCASNPNNTTPKFGDTTGNLSFDENFTVRIITSNNDESGSSIGTLPS